MVVAIAVMVKATGAATRQMILSCISAHGSARRRTKRQYQQCDGTEP